MNEQSLPWDDLKLVLSVARAGSLSGAARYLGVSHATVFRRLGGIETRLGVRLFERSRAGYAATAAGEDVAAAAARMEAEAAGIEQRVAGRERRAAGTVRMTTTDALLQGMLSPVFTRFCREYPDISLEVAVSPALFSLARREADVAIRPTDSPPEALVGRRIGRIAQAVYVRAGRDVPDTPVLPDLDWIGPDERMGYPQLARWMRSADLETRCRLRVDSTLGMCAAVADGLGAAVLPCYLADADSRLARLGEPLDELAVDLWLLTHPDLRQAPRIRAFNDFVADAARRMRARLMPTGTPVGNASAPASASRAG